MTDTTTNNIVPMRHPSTGAPEPLYVAIPVDDYERLMAVVELIETHQDSIAQLGAVGAKLAQGGPAAFMAMLSGR